MEKKERLRLLYELERLVMSDSDDEDRIEELRSLIGLNEGAKRGRKEVLTLSEYFDLQKKGLSDTQIAEKLGVKKQSITRFKMRNNIIKKKPKNHGPFDMSVIQKGVFCPEQYKGLLAANYSNQEISGIFKLTPKTLRKYREMHGFVIHEPHNKKQSKAAE